MEIKAVIKKTVSVVVGIGVGHIVKSIIEKNVECENVAQTVTVSAASMAIGYAAAEAVSVHTDSLIDEIEESFKEIGNAFKKGPKPELKIVKN